MKSISMTWTKNVDILEARFALSAVQEITEELQVAGFRRGWFHSAPLLNVFGNWIIPALPEGTPYRSLQWYIDQSYDRASDTIIGTKLLELLLNEPWQRSNPHYDLSLVEYELGPKPEGEQSFGALVASIPGRIAVISVAPLRQIMDNRLRLFAIRRVVGHQMGHLFGIPSVSHPQSIAYSPLERHCVNVCAMRHADNLEELVRMAVEEINSGVLLCSTCRKDLLGIMVDSYFGLN